jgi:hypothetical protein
MPIPQNHAKRTNTSDFSVDFFSSLLVCIDDALAQSAPLYINAVDIDVVLGHIDNYLAALKENGARLGA